MRTRSAPFVIRAIRAAAFRPASSSSGGCGRALQAAAATRYRTMAPSVLSSRSKTDRQQGNWVAAAAILPALAYAVQEHPLQAAEVERTFIAIKPDGVQRGLIAEIISRFERKGYKLVAVKLVRPTKEFAQKHYDDLKARPFFNGLTDFLSSGPVVAMVWEGQGVIKYGRRLIGATNPLSSEPGTIRGDLAVATGRNIIHGSDGPETAVAEINLWFKAEELLSYAKDTDKWLYE